MSFVEVVNLNHKIIPIANSSISILKNIQLSGQDWMFACGEKGRCTTCRGKIISGMENLSELSIPENRFKSEGRLKEDERLMCQSFLLEKNIVISIPDPCKLPHLHYSE